MGKKTQNDRLRYATGSIRGQTGSPPSLGSAVAPIRGQIDFFGSSICPHPRPRCATGAIPGQIGSPPDLDSAIGSIREHASLAHSDCRPGPKSRRRNRRHSWTERDCEQDWSSSAASIRSSWLHARPARRPNPQDNQGLRLDWIDTSRFDCTDWRGSIQPHLPTRANLAARPGATRTVPPAQREPIRTLGQARADSGARPAQPEPCPRASASRSGRSAQRELSRSRGSVVMSHIVGNKGPTAATCGLSKATPRDVRYPRRPLRARTRKQTRATRGSHSQANARHRKRRHET